MRGAHIFLLLKFTTTFVCRMDYNEKQWPAEFSLFPKRPPMRGGYHKVKIVIVAKTRGGLF